ncbi:MAG TPA: hypothetical protein VMU02_10800, partial [bacterium]|nr:hypothetical protein [bacterium]
SSPRDLGPIGGVLLAVPPLAVPLALHLLAGAEAPAWTADAVFVAVAGFAGFIGGAVFSAASAALASQEELRGRAGAIAYSLDLVGASIAGFVTGLLIIPAVGILRSACAVAATSLIASAAAAIATWVYSRRRPR